MNEWISVKDRLPEPEVPVLTICKHGIIQGCLDSENDGTGWPSFCGYYWRDMSWYATYWMPLPEKPKK